MKSTLIAAALIAFTAQGERADLIRERLDQYLIGYEPALSTVIADELMTQRTQDRRWVVNNRRIRSEVAFLSLPGGTGWMGFRRVVEVNGKAIKDSSSATLGELMSQGRSNDYEQARALLAASAAHNLGAPRTINLPNLPLELLHPRHRRRFSHEIFARDKLRGVPTVLLRLTEQNSPTIIRQADGGDMKTVVWAWVEPNTGRLLRAQVDARDARMGVGSFSAEIRVDFKDEKKLGMLVPDSMTETFFVDRGSGSGSAKYSNYRRFETSARIVPQ